MSVCKVRCLTNSRPTHLHFNADLDDDQIHNFKGNFYRPESGSMGCCSFLGGGLRYPANESSCDLYFLLVSFCLQ